MSKEGEDGVSAVMFKFMLIGKDYYIIDGRNTWFYQWRLGEGF